MVKVLHRLLRARPIPFNNNNSLCLVCLPLVWLTNNLQYSYPYGKYGVCSVALPWLYFASFTHLLTIIFSIKMKFFRMCQNKKNNKTTEVRHRRLGAINNTLKIKFTLSTVTYGQCSSVLVGSKRPIFAMERFLCYRKYLKINVSYCHHNYL